jgi:hypothetical protein
MILSKISFFLTYKNSKINKGMKVFGIEVINTVNSKNIEGSISQLALL